MTVNPSDDARSRDLARLRDLTAPHLPHPSAPIQQALVRMNTEDQAEVIAILGRLGDPEGLRPMNELRRKRDFTWLKDWQVRALGGVCILAGFLVSLLIFRWPGNLSPDWGDLATWLLVLLAGAAGWVGFAQLATLRTQIAEEAERNKKRDELMDRQIAEAGRRERSERRRLVEGVEVSFTGRTGYVENNSKRPINDITCKVMSKVDRYVLATADGCGEVDRGPAGQGWMFLPGAKPVSTFEALRPGARCGFTFKDLPSEPDQVLVAWFTDDDGFRWQLDEYGHLVESDYESEYLPRGRA